MTPFVAVTSRAIPLPAADIDTDIIYPARFLLITDKEGLGDYAFADWRQARATPFDDPAYAGAQILVAGDNFGCGSSREHAPWALAGIGIRAIISTSFGEIFHGNCLRNGMLPVVVPADAHARLIADAEAGRSITVDLAGRQVVRDTGEAIAFRIDDWRREALLNGWDEVAAILARDMDAVAAFETRQRVDQPWLWE